MPTKKKTPKTTRGKRAAMVIDRWAAMESELDRLRKQLAEANELLKKGKETVRDHADADAVRDEALAAERAKLAAAEAREGEHLTAIRKLVDAKAKDNAANQAEIEYWMAEVNRLHYELIDMRREAAREAADAPSDDLQEIQALQDLALRGGVA